MDNLVEQLRAEVIKGLFDLKSFESKWDPRRLLLRAQIGTTPKRKDLIGLGSYLSPAFSISGAKDRSQGGVSTAGTTWESLVVWYLNLCLLGTNAVAIRGAPLCPKPLKDALSVCFENTILRSEPDVILLASQDLANAPIESSKKKMMDSINDIIEDSFSRTGVINYQCKTNWNDNAQIPMLWNMLYNQAKKGALIPNGFSIGRNGHSLKNLAHFAYGFVTVPTQKEGPQGYKATHLKVLRVKTMSAGNYWGHPTTNGVCLSLAEFFNVFNRSPVFPNVANVGDHAAKLVNEKGKQSPQIAQFRF